MAKKFNFEQDLVQDWVVIATSGPFNHDEVDEVVPHPRFWATHIAHTMPNFLSRLMLYLFFIRLDPCLQLMVTFIQVSTNNGKLGAWNR